MHSLINPQSSHLSRQWKSVVDLHAPKSAKHLFPKLVYRKSVFQPAPNQAQTYAARRHIAGAETPHVEVVHSTSRWLLLESPKVSHRFFPRLNSGKLGNVFGALLKVFNSMVALTKVYGYFRPTETMIFVDGAQIKVWINEDIFANAPAVALGRDGEAQFVSGFLAMLEGNVEGWEKVSCRRATEVAEVLDWRAQLARGSKQALQASKYVNCRPNHSKASFSEEECPKTLAACRSSQNIKTTDSPLREIKVNMSISHTLTLDLRREDGLVEEKQASLAHKTQDSEHRASKKMAPLSSTSSTLAKFSDKYKGTGVGKRLSLEVGSPRSPRGIEDELDSLFGDEQPCLGLGEEGNNPELERIAQEMEEVLLW